MAKFNKGILGPITGKLGPVIGSSWKGIPYLKTIRRNASAVRIPSPAQQAHHQKFSFLTRWLRPLHPYIGLGFRNFAAHTTEINAAFSYHFKAALKGSNPNFYMDYGQARISRGKLGGIYEVNLHLVHENTLQLIWQNKNNGLSVYSDQLMLVLYNDEIGVADGFIGGIKRSAKTCTFTFDQKLVGSYFHVFVGLIGLDAHEMSESQYLGRVEPL